MDVTSDDDSIELFSDGDGLAVIGTVSAVDQFIASSGLVPANAADKSSAFARAMTVGSGATEVASKHAETSGRWLKLTKESAENIKNMGGLTPTKTPGISHAMIGRPGASRKWIQVVNGPKSTLTSPAALASVGAVMSQIAMQQQLGEITSYLERIDEKLDALIRIQMNQFLARVDAVSLAIADAMKVREATGRVSEVAWSKVQNQPTTILETQAFALRQLADLVDKFEHKSKVADILDVSNQVQNEITSWLALLARCFQLHDAHAVLELDRVMDASPEELDQYRIGLQTARRERIEMFENATLRLLDQLNNAAEIANSKVLFNPSQSPTVVKSRNYVATHVVEFHEVLGIESRADSDEARRWRDAVADKMDQARDTGTQSLEVAKRLGGESLRLASSARDRIAKEVSERRSRDEANEPDSPEGSNLDHLDHLDHPVNDACVDGADGADATD